MKPKSDAGILRNGRYQLVRLLGRGGMSEVYLAREQGSGRAVALKRAPSAEARLLSCLNHPSIVRCLDVFEDRDGTWIVEEYVQGKTLAAFCSGPSLPPYEQRMDLAFSVGEQICDALCYLHGLKPPVIYRDLKPANIILRPDGSVKLIDFGIARFYVPRENEDTSSFGTVGYAAPEQYGESYSQSDGRSDIYGFGKLLFFLLTGEEPADLEELEWKKLVQQRIAFRPLVLLILKCTREDPEKRFRSAEEVLYELRRVERLYFDSPDAVYRDVDDERGEDKMTEYDEDYGMAKKKKRVPVNPAALALMILALLIYAGGFLWGLAEGYTGADAGWEGFRLFESLVWWAAAFAGGTLVMGLAQIVKLLHRILYELKHW